jgi:hypothetical protein
LFSYYRRQVLKYYQDGEIDDVYDPIELRDFSEPPLYEDFHFLDQYFKNYKLNPERLFWKNHTLSLLKKPHKYFVDLTTSDKLLKLTFFLLPRNVGEFMHYYRPAIIVPIERRYYSNGLRYKCLQYKNINILFD